MWCDGVARDVQVTIWMFELPARGERCRWSRLMCPRPLVGRLMNLVQYLVNTRPAWWTIRHDLGHLFRSFIGT